MQPLRFSLCDQLGGFGIAFGFSLDPGIARSVVGFSCLFDLLGSIVKHSISRAGNAVPQGFERLGFLHHFIKQINVGLGLLRRRITFFTARTFSARTGISSIVTEIAKVRRSFQLSRMFRGIADRGVRIIVAAYLIPVLDYSCRLCDVLLVAFDAFSIKYSLQEVGSFLPAQFVLLGFVIGQRCNCSNARRCKTYWSRQHSRTQSPEGLYSFTDRRDKGRHYRYIYCDKRSSDDFGRYALDDRRPKAGIVHALAELVEKVHGFS
ncbi:MAG: hypothetical protein DESF_02617 [Desulfovibrio sp.]